MKLTKRQQAVLALILANIIWGASFPIYKWALTDVPPFTFVYLRFFLGAIILFPFVHKHLHVNASDVWKLISLSLCGITLSITLLFFGLKFAPSINAPVIFSSSPILLILFAMFYLREKPTKKVLIGTWVSLFGIMLIVLRPILENGLDIAILGNVLFILSNIADNAYTVLLIKTMKRNSAMTIAFWSFLIGCAPLIPFVVLENIQHNFFTSIDMRGFVGILFGAFAATAIAHSLNAFGAKYIKTSEIGIFSYVDPVATILVAMPLLGEVITPYYLLGVLLVFAGIFIAEERIHFHPIHLLAKKMPHKTSLPK